MSKASNFFARMAIRSSSNKTKTDPSTLVENSSLGPKLSTKEINIWSEYITSRSAPASSTSSTPSNQGEGQHFQLLNDFKDFYINHEIQITDHGTVLRFARSKSSRSPEIVECLRLSDTDVSALPRTFVVIYRLSNSARNESFAYSTLFVPDLSNADPESSSFHKLGSQASFLLVAEDLQREISSRFFVPGGQSGDPLYGQYTQDDKTASIEIDRRYVDGSEHKFRAVVWKKLEPSMQLGGEELKRNDTALRRVVEQRKSHAKHLLGSGFE